jgi:hypothetical protein
MSTITEFDDACSKIKGERRIEKVLINTFIKRTRARDLLKSEVSMKNNMFVTQIKHRLINTRGRATYLVIAPFSWRL